MRSTTGYTSTLCATSKQERSSRWTTVRSGLRERGSFAVQDAASSPRQFRKLLEGLKLFYGE